MKKIIVAILLFALPARAEPHPFTTAYADYDIRLEQGDGKPPREGRARLYYDADGPTFSVIGNLGDERFMLLVNPDELTGLDIKKGEKTTIRNFYAYYKNTLDEFTPEQRRRFDANFETLKSHVLKTQYDDSDHNAAEKSYLGVAVIEYTPKEGESKDSFGVWNETIPLYAIGGGSYIKAVNFILNEPLTPKAFSVPERFQPIKTPIVQAAEPSITAMIDIFFKHMLRHDFSKVDEEKPISGTFVNTKTMLPEMLEKTKLLPNGMKDMIGDLDREANVLMAKVMALMATESAAKRAPATAKTAKKTRPRK